VAEVSDWAISVEALVFLPVVTDPAGSVVERAVVAADSVVGLPPILVGPLFGLVEVPEAVVAALLAADSAVVFGITVVLGMEGSVTAAVVEAPFVTEDGFELAELFILRELIS
jgi:hypothetical protein